MNLSAAEKESMSTGTLRSARDRGRIEVFPAVVGAIAGHAAIECYGVMGMAARGLRDRVADLLRRENLHRRVEGRGNDCQPMNELSVGVPLRVRVDQVAHQLQSGQRFE